jgi:hypothetical protein
VTGQGEMPDLASLSGFLECFEQRVDEHFVRGRYTAGAEHLHTVGAKTAQLAVDGIQYLLPGRAGPDHGTRAQD